MAGKAIIHTPASMGPMGKFHIYLDGKEVAVAGHGEITTLPIHSDCKLQVRCSADMKTSPMLLPANKLTEIDFSPGFFGIKPVIVRQVEFESAKEDATIMHEIRNLLADCKSGKISIKKGVDKFCSLQEDIIDWTPDIEREITAINDELGEIYERQTAHNKGNAANNDTNEHRMRCNVCGHIFCYTDEDVKKNLGNAGMGALTALGGLASALGGGTIFHTHHLQGQADRYTDKIIDYNRCPACHSNNISEIEDGEVMQANSTPISAIPTTSAADELKKFKELLDMGIITQEEFDAKKKQLLGL